MCACVSCLYARTFWRACACVCARALFVGNVPWNWSLACDSRDVNTIMSVLQLKSGLGEVR